MSANRKPALGFIFLTLLIDITGLGIIIPVMPTLISELIHGDLPAAASYGGWLMSSYAIMLFVCAPIMGGLSDRYGRRPILLASLFGFGIDYLIVAFAPTIGWLFAGRIIAGIMGASITTATAYIADVSPPEKRAQNFGIIGAAFGVGFILGPVIGGLLGAYGSRVPFYFAAGLSFLNFLYGYFILPESLKPENRRTFSWKRANPVGSLMGLKRYPAITGLVAAAVLIYIAAYAVQSTWTYYTMEKFGWNETMVGISLAVVGAMYAMVQGLFLKKIIASIGQKMCIYLGLGLYTIGFVLFAFASNSWMMFAFTTVYCLGGIAGPSLQGTISSHVPADAQGELQGALTSLVSVTAIIGPLFMTSLFSYFSKGQIYFPGAPMLAGAVLTLISGFVAYRSLNKFSGEQPG